MTVFEFIAPWRAFYESALFKNCFSVLIPFAIVVCIFYLIKEIFSYDL